MILKKTLIMVVALLSGSVTFAQIHRMEHVDSNRARRTYNLNPIVVTGSAHHERVGSSVTPVRVLTSRDFAEQGITTLDGAIQRMLPQVSMAPNSLGSFLRLNGLGGKYILILVNGQKLTGDISSNVDLSRINMSRVKRIEVLDGAASTLYGSDAIGGVINIITDQPTQQPVSVTSDTRMSGHGQLTESLGLDVFAHGIGSYTSFTHDRADSYQLNDTLWLKGDTTFKKTIAPLFTGYRSNVFNQRFTFAPTKRLALNTGIDVSDKLTDRPDTRSDIDGGTDYEMRYRGLRWNMGGIYKFSNRNSLQADFTYDRFRYGKQYDVATDDNAIGDYVQSKHQRTLEGGLKGILGLSTRSTTIVGADWRQDNLEATTGNIDQHVYTFAAYAQHEVTLLDDLTATVGLRLTHHEAFNEHLTPKASLMYAPGRFRFRASYSAGFRAPGLDELYYHYFSVNRGKPQIIFGDPNLSPEKSNYVSLNAEYRADWFILGITGYVNHINDMVVKKNIDVDAASLAMLQDEFPEMTAEQAGRLERYSLYQNSDEGDVKGLQVSMQAMLINDFSITANYAYIYARSKSDGEWRPLERSIRNTAVVAANYHHTWRYYGLGVNINLRAQSKTLYPDYEDAPGYGIVNINTTHTFDNPRLPLIEPSIGIDNIFNKVDRRADGSLRKYALYSPGRMVVVGLKVKFRADR